jgi:hypothetical protein
VPCGLNLVDGRKTVEDIATQLRDSSLNTGCYLLSLMVQGFIRRLAVAPTRAVPTAPPVMTARVPIAASAPARPGPSLRGRDDPPMARGGTTT